MPLAGMAWTKEVCAGFVAAKEACRDRDGLGHWAFVDDGGYLGWGGFRKEGEDWDFGLLLRLDRFGRGMEITRQALAFARADPRIPHVTVLLPPTRTRLGAPRRMGAVRAGEL